MLIIGLHVADKMDGGLRGIVRTSEDLIILYIVIWNQGITS